MLGEFAATIGKVSPAPGEDCAMAGADASSVGASRPTIAADDWKAGAAGPGIGEKAKMREMPAKAAKTVKWAMSDIINSCPPPPKVDKLF
jgi:hypothetical protein